MEYTTHLFFFLFALPGIFSEAFPTGEELPELLECEQYCHGYQRVCAQPPFQCGGCRSRFQARDGECLPFFDDDDSDVDVKSNGVDGDIDDLAAKRSAAAAAADGPQLDVQEDNNDADIPDNAEVHVIPHNEKHSQEEKVEALFAAAADTTPANAAAAAVTKEDANMADVYFLAVVAGCSIAGLIGLVVAGVCWYRLQKNVKAASESEYPAYGVTGPVPEKVASPGDRKLAQSAQMYHYQHQKQQMIAMEKANGDMTKDGSDADSEEENEEGDYTVYECPGLAPTGEMEVKNPLFSEETPVTPSADSPPK